MKRWQTLVIGIAISALFLFIIFWQADFGRIVQAFRNARYEYLAAGFAVVVLTTFVRGLRWQVLTQGRLSMADGFWLFNVGFLFNNVLPARLGELARSYLAGRRPQMHFTSALSSIVVERLFDFVAIAMVLGMVVPVLPLPRLIRIAGLTVAAGSVTGIVILAAAARRPEWALSIGTTLLSLLPKIDEETARDFLQPFVEGLGGVSNLRTFALGMGISLFAWLVSGFSTWVIMLAFWRAVPISHALLTVGAAGLGIAVPAAPSGVGPLEAAVIGVLTGIDYNADVARSFAFTLHGVNIIVTSVLGMVGLMREGMSFQDVAREARSMRQNKTDDNTDDLAAYE